MRTNFALLALASALATAGCNKEPATTQTGTASPAADEAGDARTLVQEAAKEVETMKSDPQLVKLMKQARGIYIVPEFGRGALIVGGRGGAGLVVANNGGKWSPPAFYNFGALSVGAQAGGSGGQIAFLLKDNDALNSFLAGNKVAANAGSGVTIVNYSANGQASWGKGDVMMWSDTEGAYAGATVSVSDVNWDDGKNQAFYGPAVQPNEVLSGKVTTNQDTALQSALP